LIERDTVVPGIVEFGSARMADVFLSYRNTPERRALVGRLAFILRVHEISVWWDYGLEAGESYRAQITTELANAHIVAPLWCGESILSPWVRMEAELGKDKLLPARLQKVAPPEAFEAIQAADLIGWDGTVSHPRLQAYVRKIAERLGRSGNAPTDSLEQLAHLPRVTPLPEAPAAAAPPAATGGEVQDYAFWKAEWDAHRVGVDLVALQAIADHAPPYFASQARARIGQIEAEQRRLVEAQERQAREAEAKRREEAERAERERRLREGPWDILVGSGSAARPTTLKAGDVFRDFDDGPELVVIPPGRFMMGTDDAEIARLCKEYGVDYFKWEAPQHEVGIAQPFAAGRFAVTFEQWDAFAAATNGHKPADQGWGRGRRPAINVSWNDAQAYVQWLAKKTGQPYRLLSEAEWEYAARAGSKTAFWWGDTISTGQANYDGNYTYGGGGKGEYRQKTVPVDSFEPNAFGLYQVHGNVWEWVEDCFNDSYKDAPNDGSVKATEGCVYRVLRGGSWVNLPRNLRAAVRIRLTPANRYNYLSGFRVARSVSSPRTR
jgi:formylglycine-generating enzyme required for sulfatase activity